MASDDDLDALTASGEQLIHSILAEDPLDAIQSLIADGAPLWYQNVAEGISCLHAAAYTQNLELGQADYLRNTAGDIALSFNNQELYTLIRDAGIRQEMLMGILGSSFGSDSTIILRATDDTAAASDKNGQDICLVNVDGEVDVVGVMMSWERNIMEQTVERMKEKCKRTHGLRVLNIGFGLGIIDTLFQALAPSLHVIVEPHPDVLKHMKERGWHEKPGVKILEGKWEDFINDQKLADLVPEGGFDMVYTDCFSEDYAALRDFFKRLPALQGPRNGSVFSFFNGLGATNPTIYDVSTRIAELHLAELGFDVQWSDVDLRQQWDRWGDTRQYFSCPIYRLPLVVN
ncbi:arginine methyl transferase [Mycena amicta]|nr:arginine methyl transferase [Mycena amicta]